MKTALMIAIAVAAAGCGGKAPDQASAGDRGFGQSHADTPHASPAKPEGHGEMSPQLAKFHDTLAPRWHAERGPQRIADTCGAMEQFRADGDALAASPAPRGADAAAWTDRGKQLTEAVAALDVVCRTTDTAAFEQAFERVHRAFHGMMEAGGGDDDHGMHEGGEKPAAASGW
jgi:hypothetical protein